MEVDAVQREAQPLPFVIGEKLRVEHREVNPVPIFPIFWDEHVVHIERPSHRRDRGLGLEPDFDNVDDLRQRLIGFRAEVGDRRAVRLGRLRGYDLYRGDFRWAWWLHDVPRVDQYQLENCKSPT